MGRKDLLQQSLRRILPLGQVCCGVITSDDKSGVAADCSMQMYFINIDSNHGNVDNDDHHHDHDNDLGMIKMIIILVLMTTTTMMMMMMMMVIMTLLMMNDDCGDYTIIIIIIIMNTRLIKKSRIHDSDMQFLISQAVHSTEADCNSC